MSEGYVDLHCHYLPGIDDGVRTLDEGIRVLAGLRGLGYAKVIATPHIRTAMFDNRKPGLERAYAEVDAARVLLVIGSSLAVFSGYRFVKRAAREGRPVALVNLGESRGDPHATLSVQARAGEVLPRVAEALGVLTHP